MTPDGWMAEFAGSILDLRLRDRLEFALRGRGPFRRFKDVLGQHPAARQQWFGFHDERVQRAMREWLEDHGFELSTPLPRRFKGA